jgi:anti-anti-sigma factor
MPKASSMLRICAERDGSNFYLRLTGELDFSNVKLLNGELDRLEKSDAEQLIVDLTGLEFIDSSGIALLVRASQRSAEDSNRLRIKRSDHLAVKRILGVARVENGLPFID